MNIFDHYDPEEILEKTSHLYSAVSRDERLALIKMAKNMNGAGLIICIDGLYGCIPSILGLANPWAHVVVIDDFSKKIENEPDRFQLSVEVSARATGAENVLIFEGSSLSLGQSWGGLRIDILFIDGDHEYESTLANLNSFGRTARIIAVHNYGDDRWPGVKQAVANFLVEKREWRIDGLIDSLIILKSDTRKVK